MYFCDDVNLLTWEPALFLDPAFIHQALFKNASATIAGTTLTTADPLLAPALPGMVIAITQGDLTQLLEITALADDHTATISALRGRSTEAPIPSLVSGPVQATLVTFRPQIAAVGDALLALLGVPSDRTTPTPALANAAGFRTAAVFETLAALLRILAEQKTTANVIFPKLKFYENLAAGARKALSATIDTNADNSPDTPARSNTIGLQRA